MPDRTRQLSPYRLKYESTRQRSAACRCLCHNGVGRPAWIGLLSWYSHSWSPVHLAARDLGRRSTESLCKLDPAGMVQGCRPEMSRFRGKKSFPYCERAASFQAKKVYQSMRSGTRLEKKLQDLTRYEGYRN